MHFAVSPSSTTINYFELKGVVQTAVLSKYFAPTSDRTERKRRKVDLNRLARKNDFVNQKQINFP